MLSGKTIVFTGTLTMKRADATAQAVAAGATVGGSVTAKTNILVAGPGAGAKMEEAKAKGIEVWTEAEFQAALAGGGGGGGGGAAAVAGTKKSAPSSSAPAEEQPPAKKAKGKAKAEPPLPPASPAAKQPTASPAATPGGTRILRPDRNVPNAANYAVYNDYDVKLMQTNLGENNNKFYIIQVLEGQGGFFCWTRWGRLGEVGQSKLDPCGGDADSAIKEFGKKFKEKTKNAWEARASFVKHDGKYQERDARALQPRSAPQRRTPRPPQCPRHSPCARATCRAPLPRRGSWWMSKTATTTVATRTRRSVSSRPRRSRRGRRYSRRSRRSLRLIKRGRRPARARSSSSPRRRLHSLHTLHTLCVARVACRVRSPRSSTRSSPPS